jgi:NAD(P)-dependent dehydrogenase (short-subunit alcohol dehydrogenase family)
LRTIEPPPLSDPMLAADALAGRAALVTGGASGVGFAMAAGMARCGAAIALVGRNAERLEAAAARIRELGVPCAITTADVRKPEAVAAAFDTAEAALGPITIVANNAGSNFPAAAATMSPNAWYAITRINLDGTYFCSAEFYRRCVGHGLRGSVINNSASYALTGFPATSHAAASKAAVNNLTLTLASEWAPDGIRVNGIMAGFYNGSQSADFIEGPNEGDSIIPPAGRSLRSQELGWAAAFLASDYASYVTGLNLMIDGGEWLGHAAQALPYVPLRYRTSPW